MRAVSGTYRKDRSIYDVKKCIKGSLCDLTCTSNILGTFDSKRENTMLEKSRILIADDNQPNVELLEAYLAEVDCDIAIAFDGQEALDKVASFQPDLILLDIMMPKLNGFEVCKQLKETPETRQIMILMVTALNELGDIERAVNAGTNDFISKPVTKLELLKRVENMLRLKDITDENERLRQYIEKMEETSGPIVTE